MKRAYFEYLLSDGAKLFTVVCLPEKEGRFPTLIYRNPYVDDEEALTEQEICEKKLGGFSAWLDAGYAVVFQHCRGRGRSEGDCIPYIFEREDGLLLQAWVREQSFYNGEIYLWGSSYTSSVHFVTAPFAADVKGAVLEVQDSERYNIVYRNGFFKWGLHGGWYFGMYKKKSGLKKCFVNDSAHMLPLSDLSVSVLGEHALDFDEALRHPKREDPFWKTRFGGGEAQGALSNAGIPILLVTGFYDIYTGGIFDMWNSLDGETRALSALAVHPFAHNGSPSSQPIPFANGTLKNEFLNYAVRWCDSVRGKCEPPFARGKVTYYKLFGDAWCCDGFERGQKTLSLPLGEGQVSYRYNPYAPASFPGGLSTNFGGSAWQDAPNSRYDIISLYTPVFEKDTFIRGKMTASLKVSSDCEDTCFYLRVSLAKREGDYGLRDDIQQISNFDAEYRPGGELDISFSFDEHAFVIRAGERLRIDISSSASPHYVPHTNRRGLFSEQVSARVANNTVFLDRSRIELPIAEESE